MDFFYFVNSNYLELRIKSRLICHFKQKCLLVDMYCIYVLHIVALFESPVHDRISVIRLIFDAEDVIDPSIRLM